MNDIHWVLMIFIVVLSFMVNSNSSCHVCYKCWITDFHDRNSEWRAEDWVNLTDAHAAVKCSHSIISSWFHASCSKFHLDLQKGWYEAITMHSGMQEEPSAGTLLSKGVNCSEMLQPRGLSVTKCRLFGLTRSMSLYHIIQEELIPLLNCNTFVKLILSIIFHAFLSWWLCLTLLQIITTTVLAHMLLNIP